MTNEAEVIEVATLPAGPGVIPVEVGTPGPWYGVRLPDGTAYGWWGVRAGAEHWAERFRAGEVSAGTEAIKSLAALAEPRGDK